MSKTKSPKPVEIRRPCPQAEDRDRTAPVVWHILRDGKRVDGALSQKAALRRALEVAGVPSPRGGRGT